MRDPVREKGRMVGSKPTIFFKALGQGKNPFKAMSRAISPHAPPVPGLRPETQKALNKYETAYHKAKEDSGDIVFDKAKRKDLTENLKAELTIELQKSRLG